MVIITPQNEIDEYFSSPALGQSSLKHLIGGMDNFLYNQNKVEEGPKKEHFIIGSAVDTILTGEEDEFDKQYYVSELDKKPSDAEMAITSMIFDELTDNLVSVDMTLENYPNMIEVAINDLEWQMKWKTETRINKIVEKCSEYFENLKSAYGKTVISVAQKTTIDNIVMSLSTNERTAKYFNREVQEKEIFVDFYYQLPIYFNYRGVDCKALMDLVIVVKNTEGSIIKVKPIDLKTMAGSTLLFNSSLKTRRYDIQGAWYTLAVNSWLRGQDTLSNIVIDPFLFIVESSTHQGTPLVFKMHEDLLKMGKSGREAEINYISKPEAVLKQQILGYDDLLDDYLFYESNDWSLDKRIPINNSTPILLNWNGIVKDGN